MKLFDRYYEFESIHKQSTATSIPSQQPNLLLYYKFDESIGPFIINYSLSPGSLTLKGVIPDYEDLRNWMVMEDITKMHERPFYVGFKCPKI